MDNEYICNSLFKWSSLLYGKESKPFAKEKDGLYIFGCKKGKHKNIVDKQMALYLATNQIIEYEKHKANKKKISKSRKKKNKIRNKVH